MQCVSCGNRITPGLELSLAGAGGSLCHCPYCLHAQPTDRSDGSAAPSGAENVSVDRFERRRLARELFVGRLLAAAGELHCPGCQGRLNKDDELALRNGEQFCCPHCSVDLAERAYRAVAYDEERWLPVVAALARVRRHPSRSDCATCAYLGAVATACRRALAQMAGPHPDETQLLAELLDQPPRWTLPDCDIGDTCVAAREYRKLAAAALAVL